MFKIDESSVTDIISDFYEDLQEDYMRQHIGQKNVFGFILKNIIFR